MRAYYISADEGQYLTDIDVGIGSIAYWEYYSFDILVIAKNRKAAWAIFVKNYIEARSGDYDENGEMVTFPTLNLHDFSSNDDYGYQQLKFIEIATEVDADEGIIKPLSGHPLCEIIQNHPQVSCYAQNQYGDYDKPKWAIQEATNG